MRHPIIARLESRDPEIRRAACVDAGNDASAVILVDALANALGDLDRSVARAASDTLVQIASTDPGVETALRRMLRSADPRKQLGAAFTSTRLGPPEPRLIPTLVEGLQSPHGDVRWSAAKLLVDVGHLHGEVLPIVLGLVRGGATPAVRRMAAYCTRELAPESPESAAALLDATRDADPTVRRAGFSALAKLIDPPADVTARLIEVVRDDPDPAVRRIGAVALGHVGTWASPERRSAVHDTLRVAAASEDPLLVRAATNALAHLSNTTPT